MTDRFIEGQKLRQLHEKEDLIRIKEDCRALLVSCLGLSEHSIELPDNKIECIKMTEDRISSFIGPLFGKKKTEPLKHKYHIRIS